MKLGFIGLGAMGLPMATALLKTEHDLVAYDINPSQMKAFDSAGGNTAESAQEAAQDADVLLLMVLNDKQIDKLLFEENCLAALAKNATIITFSTIAPTYVKSLAKKLSEASVSLIDAPVSGGVLGAEEKRLSIMTSGPKDAFEKVEELLNKMGQNVYYLGEENSHGSAMKIVNQILAGVHLAAAAEAIHFAQSYGLNPKTVQDIIQNSAGQSWMLNDRGARMLESKPEVKSSVDIWPKDLGIVKDVARELGISVPLTAKALELFVKASSEGLGKEDDSQVIKAFQKSASKAKE